jgi:hypothetical protein
MRATIHASAGMRCGVIMVTRKARPDDSLRTGFVPRGPRAPMIREAIRGERRRYRHRDLVLYETFTSSQVNTLAKPIPKYSSLGTMKE